MMKRFAISAALAGGLFAGVLGAAGAAEADFDYDAPYYGTARQYDAPYYDTAWQYDAPYYGTPMPGRYDARCYGTPAEGPSVFIGPNGVAFGLSGGGMVTAGPGGVGYPVGC